VQGIAWFGVDKFI